MNPLYQTYLSLLGELENLLIQLSQMMENKRRVAAQGDLSALNGCINREQALSLALRSMECRREEISRQLQLPDLCLSALIEYYPPALQGQFRQRTERVQNQYSIYRSASEAARITLEGVLRQIELRLDGYGEQVAQPLEATGSRADIRV